MGGDGKAASVQKASGTLTPCSCRNNILPVISPSTTKELPEGYVERVKHVHDSGGYGSRGYEYDWSKEEANKNLLRNHKTAVSVRMLYELAKV
nr:phenylalanine--trna ligase alpha subunit, cytoplasmic [Quercus suber]